MPSQACRHCGHLGHAEDKCWFRPAKGSTIAATIGSSVYHRNKCEARIPPQGHEHWPPLKSLRLNCCFQNLLAKAREQEAKIASLNQQIAACEKALKAFVTEAVAESMLADAAAAEEKKFGGDASLTSRMFKQMMEDQQDDDDDEPQEDAGAPSKVRE